MNNALRTRTDWLVGEGEFAELVRKRNWATTALGARASWPTTLRSLLNTLYASRIAMCVAWGRDWRLFYNDAFTPILGERHSGALGEPALEVWDEAESILNVIEQGNSLEFEQRAFNVVRHGASKKTPFVLGATPIVLEDGSIGGALLTALESADHWEVPARATSPGVQDAVVSVDGQGRITEWNHAAERRFGYLRIEAVGVPLEILLSEPYQPLLDHIARLARDPSVQPRLSHPFTTGEGESRLDGTLHKSQIDGNPIVTLSIRDQSESRILQQEHLVLSEVGSALASLDFREALTNVTQSLARTLSDHVTLCLPETSGNLRRVAAASHRAADDWAARILPNLPTSLRPEHPAYKAMSTRATVEVEVARDEYDGLAESADHLLMLYATAARYVLCVPLLVSSRCVGVLGLAARGRPFSADERRLAEEVARHVALFVERERLLVSEKRATRSRDEVLATVAHDLGNWVNTIALHVQLLREPERRNLGSVEAIGKATHVMNRIIQDLLQMARIEAGSLEVNLAPIFAEPVVREVIDAMRPAANARKIELGFDFADALPPVIADRSRLVQVLENLLNNAIKFTPPHGRVFVAAQLSIHEVLFRVADTGCGISAQNLDSVFDRFQRASRHHVDGSGLGLAIAKGIVEAHGGRIWAESALDRGSTFFFTLPRAKASSSAATG